MKRSFTVILLSCFICALALPLHGQEAESSGRKTVFYSFVINKVPDRFNFPLIGFLNFAEGSHSSAHIGFFNRNQRDFSFYEHSINEINKIISGARFSVKYNLGR